jgi:hypothetical protein
MRVITNVPIITENTSNCCGTSSFDDFSYVNDKPKKEKRAKEVKSSKQGFFSEEKRKERKSKRLANKKPKKNARKLFSKKDKTGEEKFFYPLTKLFKKDGKWFKKHKDGTTSEVKDKDVIKPDPSFRFYDVKTSSSEELAIDKNEVQKVTGNVANYTQNLIQGLKQFKPSEISNVLPIAVDDEKVTITDEGAFLDEEVQDKNKPTEDVKKDEKNKLTKNQKYLLYGIGVVAVGLIGFALYKNFSKGKSSN